MRLLFDENLSNRLPALVDDLFPGLRHSESVVGFGATDEAVWEAAATGNYLLVTKDEDFQRFSIWRGSPPKVVWVRLGNCTTGDVARLLRESRDILRSFVDHPDATFLVLG